MTKLGGLTGFWEDYTATAINAQGQVAGYGVTAEDAYDAVEWQGTTAADLGTTGSSPSSAYGINDIGVIVGQGPSQAFVWQNGTMTGLSTPGSWFSGAYAVNRDGQIVGFSWQGNQIDSAYLWQNGQAIDLDAGYSVSCAYSINDSGWIVGIADYGQGVLWQPVPEPSSLVALGCPLLGLVA